jgi:hypothetical protein
VPFTAVVEMTAFVDPVETAGHHLVYLPLYVEPTDPRFELSDDELRASFWRPLKQMYPHLTDDDLLAFQVSRVRNVFQSRPRLLRSGAADRDLGARGCQSRAPRTSSTEPSTSTRPSSSRVTSPLTCSDARRWTIGQWQAFRWTSTTSGRT